MVDQPGFDPTDPFPDRSRPDHRRLRHRRDDFADTASWLAALHEAPVEPTPWTGHVEPYPLRWPPEVERAVVFLAERAGQATYREEQTSEGPLLVVEEDPHDLTSRAAAILTAAPWAPEFERTLGLTGRYAGLGPVPVRCAACKRRWTCQIEDDYFGGRTKSDGFCLTCALADARPDFAVAAIEGKVVAEPPAISPRRPVPELPASTTAPLPAITEEIDLGEGQ